MSLTEDRAFTPSGLTGVRTALFNLVIEAIVTSDDVIKDTGLTLLHSKNVDKYPGAESEKEFTAAPQGWELTKLLNGKVVLLPVYSDEDVVKEPTAFFYYKEQWYPTSLNCSVSPTFPALKIIEIFKLCHDTYSDASAINAQSVVSGQIIESAETVLRVPSEVIDWLLINK